MTTVQKIQSQEPQKKPLLTPKNTGYAALGAMALTTLRATSKNKTIKSSHKTLGWITVALTALHIGLIEYYHLKFKKKK